MRSLRHPRAAAALFGRSRTPGHAVFATLTVVAAVACLPATAQADFGISHLGVEATEEGGSPDLQAGSHPWELTTSVGFDLEAGPSAPGGPYTEGDVRDLHLEEPPGLIEDPAAVPECSVAQFETLRISPFEASEAGESCPDKSQVGIATLDTSLGLRSFGLFELTPPPGFPAQIGAAPFGVPLTLTPHIRQAGGEYGLTLDLRNLTQSFDLRGVTLTLWGTPWSITHNTQRGDCLNEADPEDPWGKCSVGRPHINPPDAYLSLPPSCTGTMITTVDADSWQHPGAYLPSGEPDLSDPAWTSATATGPGLQGCDKLHFDPEAAGLVTTDRAASPTGYALDFDIDEAGLTDPKLTAPTQPKKAVVVLPSGMTLNPSLAAGLGVCTPASYEAETVSSPPGAGCPNTSKIGTFTVTSPLFAESLQGSLFLAQPFDNPFGSLLALYIVAKAPQRGLIVKVAGQVALDQQSGQLTATFDDLPQLPYSHFQVLFREGQRSPLLTPQSCGSYSAQIAFSPWLDPESTLAETSSFPVSSGIEGGPCPDGTAAPFAPQAQAGTLNSNAGSYTPFYLHLARKDTEQEITSYSAQLPPGLLARIAGIPYCPEADIAAAKAAGGVAETEHPSCPAASQIGHTVSGYGVGPVLAYAPGGLYLAGPYHGSPLSIVAIDAATVGPFDLGTIVVRSAIRVDPLSAQVSVDSSGSDPIPHIVDGIPIHLRDIRVYIDRPGFTVNPTSCDPFAVASALTGSSAPFTDPADATATASVRFQVSDCSSLGFAPKLALHLVGQTRRGAYPSLRAIVTPRPGDANIAAAAVTLPSTEFLAQEHIGTVCTRPQFVREACPVGSIYGRATAVTPLLEKPLEGLVYLRSSENLLPDLVASLHGQGVTIDLDGRIDSHHGALRGTFEGLPDAPVSKFTMVLFGGRKKGLLVNERDICTQGKAGSARFLAQDDSTEVTAPRLEAHCPKSKKKKKKGAHKKEKGGPGRSHHRGDRR